jgi:hypothetical protein
MRNCLHFFLEKLGLNFDTISLFTTLYSFVWLNENQWNYGWNFQICSMNFKKAREENLNTNVKKEFQNPS